MDDIEIRPAGLQDADAIADVYLASFRAAYDFPPAHSDAQVRRWIRETAISTKEAWVAVSRRELVIGMMVLTPEALDQLYLAPGWTGLGVGGRLVELAKTRRPGGLKLATFQVNTGAMRFYERHGFSAVSRGDGSGNEEGQPDVQYSWPPRAGRPGEPGPGY
jgi:GNAT superfamily N-acetyltransferase